MKEKCIQFTLSPRPRANGSDGGFTLIEMSIALVIIGLVVAGIVAGVQLLETARIQRQISQIADYEAAVNTFKLTYNAIPGDMSSQQASTFFPGVGAATCDNSGRNNGAITGQTLDIDTACREPLYAFKHLGASGLLKKTFDGTFSRAGVPAAALKDSMSLVLSERCCGVTESQLSTAESDLRYSVALYVSYVAFSSAGQGVLTGTNQGMDALTAYSIDAKLDDGVARQGKVKAYRLRGNNVFCLDATDGNYNITNGKLNCTLEYIVMR